MATLQQEEDERAQLSTKLNDLKAISPESLVRRDELGGDLSFEPGLPYFSRTLRLFEILREANLDGVPHGQLTTLNQYASRALDEFRAVQSFSIQAYPQNPAATRDALIAQIRDGYDQFFSALSPVISYSVRKGTDFDSIERQGRETLKQLQDVRNEQNKIVAQIKSEADQLLASIRQAAAEAGVSQHAIYFRQEAESHEKASWWWLAVTVFLAGITFWFALYSVNLLATSAAMGQNQSIQVGIAKLLAFSVLYFALVWCGRNYLALKHNQIVNKHRQNALSTFQAFVKAAGSDETTKNAVLIKATEAIFSPEVTGYLGKEPDPRATSQILEIVRGFEK